MQMFSTCISADFLSFVHPSLRCSLSISSLCCWIITYCRSMISSCLLIVLFWFSVNNRSSVRGRTAWSMWTPCCFHVQTRMQGCLTLNCFGSHELTTIGGWFYSFIGCPSPFPSDMFPCHRSPGFGDPGTDGLTVYLEEKVRMAGPFPVTCFHVTVPGYGPRHRRFNRLEKVRTA